MIVSDTGKFVLLAIALVGAILMVITNAERTLGGGAFLAIIGYLTGNVVSAARAQPPSAAIEAHPDRLEAPDG